MDVNVSPNARVFVTGKTGSGKTYFSKQLLSGVQRLAVFDIKNNLSKDMNLEPVVSGSHINKSVWRRFWKGNDGRIQITAPVGHPNEFEFYHDWFRRVYFAADCVIYIDELLGVVPNAVNLPLWLKAIYTRGREPIKKRGRIVGGNIGVVACSQRPAHIPAFCMTESEQFFVFQLQNPDDRKRIAAYTSPELAQTIPDEHGFYYYETRSNKPVYVPSL